jgi:hypothetical protein
LGTRLSGLIHCLFEFTFQLVSKHALTLVLLAFPLLPVIIAWRAATFLVPINSRKVEAQSKSILELVSFVLFPPPFEGMIPVLM